MRNRSGVARDRRGVAMYLRLQRRTYVHIAAVLRCSPSRGMQLVQQEARRIRLYRAERGVTEAFLSKMDAML